MNVLLIAHERNLGGASKSLVTLADELQKRGHKVIVVVPFKHGTVYAKLKEMQISTYKIFFGWWMMPSYWNFLLKAAFWFLYATERIAVKKIVRLAKKEHIQVIHSNSSVIDVGALAAKKSGLPHVWHFREFGDADYQLKFLKGMEKSCTFVTESASRVIFISKSLRNYYKGYIPDRACQVIYNGVSQNFLTEKDFTRTIFKPVFLIAGNLHRSKGQNIALEAAKILREKGILNFEIWIAGQASAMRDSKKFEAELRKFAEDNLQGFCKFLGFVPNMSELRKRADVELVCSNCEAFGRVTVEAMLAGNPVIGTDTGANPELIEDKKTGRLFMNKDSSDLADKMQWFIEETGYITECGKKAQRYAQKHFLSSQNTENIEKVYRLACSDDNRREKTRL